MSKWGNKAADRISDLLRAQAEFIDDLADQAASGQTTIGARAIRRLEKSIEGLTEVTARLKTLANMKREQSPDSTIAGVGRAIAAMRQAHGWSIRDLEAKSGVNQASISRIESGVSATITLENLVGIADAFGIPLDALIGREA